MEVGEKDCSCFVFTKSQLNAYYYNCEPEVSLAISLVIKLAIMFATTCIRHRTNYWSVFMVLSILTYVNRHIIVNFRPFWPKPTFFLSLWRKQTNKQTNRNETKRNKTKKKEQAKTQSTETTTKILGNNYMYYCVYCYIHHALSDRSISEFANSYGIERCCVVLQVNHKLIIIS